MKKAADILYLLATFSLRTNFIEKAIRYSSAGYQMFPDDIRLVEIHAYILLLEGRYQEAEEVLASSEMSSGNMDFLRSRTSIILDLPKSEQQSRIRRYLAA